MEIKLYLPCLRKRFAHGAGIVQGSAAEVREGRERGKLRHAPGVKPHQPPTAASQALLGETEAHNAPCQVQKH